MPNTTQTTKAAKADYFGALMRSGGLSQPARSRAVEHPAAGVQETVAQVVAAQPAPAAIERPPVRPPEVDAQMVTPAAPRPPEATAVLAAVAPATDPAPRSVQVEPPAVPQQVASQTDPDPARSVVRTVMQWVAADPNASPSVATSRVAAPTPATPASSDRATPTLATVIGPTQRRDAGPASTLDRDEASQPVHAQASARIDAPTDIAWPAPRFAMPATRSTPAELPVSEPLTVTIGAIHVRVEAPAVQTVAPPAARPAPERMPQRSGLSRRALRRI